MDSSQAEEIIEVFCIAGYPLALKPSVFVMISNNTARPDFAEIDVFLGQHKLLTLEHFNQKM